MSDTGSGACVSEDDSNTQMNTHLLYNELVRRYKKTTNKIEKLEEKKNLLKENIIFYFIKKEIEKDRVIKDEVIFNIMTNEYDHRFTARKETEDDIKWAGHYTYNYGDLVYDTSIEEKCIVLKETQYHIWLWYYNKTPQKEHIEIKEKYNDTIIVIKYCNIVEE